VRLRACVRARWRLLTVGNWLHSDQAIAAVSPILEPPKAIDNHGAIAAPPARVYASLILDAFEILGTSEVRPLSPPSTHSSFLVGSLRMSVSISTV
jgi:hypothetical protein